MVPFVPGSAFGAFPAPLVSVGSVLTPDEPEPSGFAVPGREPAALSGRAALGVSWRASAGEPFGFGVEAEPPAWACA